MNASSIDILLIEDDAGTVCRLLGRIRRLLAMADRRAVEQVRGEFERRTWDLFFRTVIEGLSPAAVGQPAPLFSLPSLLGSTVALSAYRGDLVLAGAAGALVALRAAVQFALEAARREAS